MMHPEEQQGYYIQWVKETNTYTMLKRKQCQDVTTLER